MSSTPSTPSPEKVRAEKERLAYEAGKQAQRDRDRQGLLPAPPPPPPPPPPPRGGSGDSGVGTLLALGALGGAGYMAWKKRAALKRALGVR